MDENLESLLPPGALEPGSRGGIMFREDPREQQRQMPSDDGNLFYYGCLDGPGHFLYKRGPNGNIIKAEGKPNDVLDQNPWGRRIDGCLCDMDEAHEHIEGECHVHHRKDRFDVAWTALSFHDKSVNQKPRSSSTFLISRNLTGKQLLLLAREEYPEIFRRFPFEVGET